jgi:CBS domain containing-hemolysin-like protein
MLFAAFFAGTETGMMLADPLKLQHRAEQGDGRSAQILKLKETPETLLGVLLIGNNIVTVTATVLCNRLLENWLEPAIASVLSVLALTFVMLITSEIIPKLVFQSRPESLSRSILPVLRFFILLFRPILFVVNIFSKAIAFMLGATKKLRYSISREDISLLAEIGVQDGTIDPRSWALFGSVLAFGGTTAREIMTPLVDVIAIDEGESVDELVRVIMRSGFSRIPVYREHAFSMVGYVSAFDLKKSRRNENISEYIRQAAFVPESKNIDSLLIEMRQNHLALVFVVDEWGGTAGIITHEDIAEHVVGQILDKGEKAELEMQSVGHGEYLADGWTDIDKARQVLRIKIEKKGFETVGGFLEHIMQRIPHTGESIRYEGYQFYVEEADATRIIRVRIKQKKSDKKTGKNEPEMTPVLNGKTNGQE